MGEVLGAVAVMLFAIAALFFRFSLGEGAAAKHCTNYGKTELHGKMYECKPIGN